MGIESAKMVIQDAVRRRSETDKRMSGAWVAAYVISYLLIIVGTFLGVFQVFTALTMEEAIASLGLGIALVLIGLVLVATLTYNLIKRRNEHFKRSRVLREGLIQYLEARAKERDKSSEVSSELGTMRMIHSELNSEESEKSAGLYTLLSLLTGIVFLYVMYFLTNDFMRHDKRERAFYQAFVSASRKLDISIQFPYWREVPDRSAGLYIILTLVLGGIFSLYWLWTLIKDPQEHFNSHALFEDSLLPSL